jgi:hypothetical protein
VVLGLAAAAGGLPIAFVIGAVIAGGAALWTQVRPTVTAPA